MSVPPKTSTGRFFEDFALGERIEHATPRTVSEGDIALYVALYGARFAVQSSDAFARAIGYPRAPVDDLLVFHIVFGKTVADISLNAVANLGYAECRFLAPVYPGDTLSASSEVIGLRATSSGDSGVVYVRTTGYCERGPRVGATGGDAAGEPIPVLSYIRWVMVRKRDPASPPPMTVVPQLSSRVDPGTLAAASLPALRGGYNFMAAGSGARWGDYQPGERIDHIDGLTIEESEHQLATRLYQNTARVHFDAHAAKDTRFGRRLIYGGVVISLARALAFNGLQNAYHLAAINGGRHVAPLFAGDTVYAASEILETASLPGRTDLGALRTRLVATKNRSTAGLDLGTPEKPGDGVILDLDCWLLLPR
jgi:2-methylfumaryl-CoA hydratase